MGGAEEDVRQVEEPRLVFDMKQLRSEKLIKLGVELWVLEVVLCDEGKHSREGQQGDGATHVVGGDQEVGHEQRLCEVGQHRLVQDQQHALVLVQGNPTLEDL